MKRLRILASITLLLLALPLWRYLDMFSWFELDRIYFTLALMSWSSLFLIFPLALIYKKILVPGLIVNSCFAVLIYYLVPTFSREALDHPQERHCSLINYSGFFFQLKTIMPAAFEDDLLIRNQICWMKKLTLSIPNDLNKHEAVVYAKIIENMLMLPEIKWKTTLPFTVPLFLKSNHPQLDIISMQKFWDDHYTAEVKDREYNFLSYPHSDYIKWEYGILESNWRPLLDSIEVKEGPH